MRSWVVVGVGASLAVLATLQFGACGGGSPPRHAGGTSAASAPARAVTPGAAADAGTGAAPSAEPGADALDAGQTEQQAARQLLERCDAPSSTIQNRPQTGVVFNNAMTSADAGFIDRMQGTLDALGGESRRFRCCFDPWTQEHPGEQGKLLLLVDLEPDGEVRRAAVDDSRSTVRDALVIECVTHVARTTAFPPSPTSRETLVEYPFVVASRENGHGD